MFPGLLLVMDIIVVFVALVFAIESSREGEPRAPKVGWAEEIDRTFDF